MPRVAKKLVLKRFYEMVGQYVPFNEACSATLAGEGTEAEIWLTVGIRPCNAWLVDRSPKVIKQVFRNFRDRGFGIHHGRLEDFPAVVMSDHGALDSFHLDVCGTAEAFGEDLSAVLPLVLRSRARMLAVTVSDTRRSPSLHDPEGVKAQARKIFGTQWEPLWESLVKLHQCVVDACQSRADPEQAALREVATLIVVFLALATVRIDGQSPDDLGLRVMPVLLERFIYISAHAGQRMRTYIFRFECVGPDQPSYAVAEVANAFACLVMSPPLSWVKETRVTPIPFPEPPRPPPPAPAPVAAVRSEDKMNNEKNAKKKPSAKQIEAAVRGIRALMKAGVFADAVCQHLETLIAAAESGSGEALGPEFIRELLLRIFINLKSGLAGMESRIRDGESLETLFMSATETSSSKTAAPAKKRRVRQKGAKPNRQVDVAEWDRIRLRILRARIAGNESQERALVCQELGMAGDGVGTTFASVLAHCSSTRCGKFVRRVLDVEAADKRDVLAAELSKLLSLDIAQVRRYGNLKPLPRS